MRARWRVILNASKEEALLAVDLYNRPTRPRRLEGFFIHMHLAWLYLFQASYERRRVEYHFRDSKGRYVRVDGEKKSWDLKAFASERWDPGHPVRKNLELTIALRNKIEHRYEEATALATAGFVQALLLNFEAELVDAFGEAESLGSLLAFPVFVGEFRRESAARLAADQRCLPLGTKRLLTEFEADLSPETRDDSRFEFRVHLVPKKGPKTAADLALTFVHLNELTDDQREALSSLGKTGAGIVRDQIRPVANAGMLKAGQVARLIDARIPFRFAASSHVKRAAKGLGALPKEGEPPERTLAQYCVFDEARQDYLYSQAFAEDVAKLTSTVDGFKQLTGLNPRRKDGRPVDEATGP